MNERNKIFVQVKIFFPKTKSSSLVTASVVFEDRKDYDLDRLEIVSGSDYISTSIWFISEYNWLLFCSYSLEINFCHFFISLYGVSVNIFIIVYYLFFFLDVSELYICLKWMWLFLLFDISVCVKNGCVLKIVPRSSSSSVVIVGDSLINQSINFGY